MNTILDFICFGHRIKTTVHPDESDMHVRYMLSDAFNGFYQVPLSFDRIISSHMSHQEIPFGKAEFPTPSSIIPSR